MVRDTEEGKPRFDLMVPVGVPYREQMLTRFAALLARGAEKYGDRNWEKGNGQEELNRARSSAFRHFMQWFCGETDEDHASAVFFNVIQVETLKYKMRPPHPMANVTQDEFFSGWGKRPGHPRPPGRSSCGRLSISTRH